MSGQSLEAFCRERIFNPLGMDNTWFVVPEQVSHRIVKRPATAPGYAWLDDGSQFCVEPLAGSIADCGFHKAVT